MGDYEFGWISPVIGPPESGHVPIVIYQAEHILPTALQHFDSVWLADHFYGFERRTDPFLESWTTITWLAARFPSARLCHHVLGLGQGTADRVSANACLGAHVPKPVERDLPLGEAGDSVFDLKRWHVDSWCRRVDSSGRDHVMADPDCW